MLTPYCDILAYCLMPDHFHLMLSVPDNSQGVKPVSLLDDSPGMQIISRKIGTILSSYTQGINKQMRCRGSLFQPRTKSKQLDVDHAFNCFYYIHQNPVAAGLVRNIEDWRYSSVHEYTGRVKGVCSLPLAAELFDLPVPSDGFLAHCDEEIRKNISLEHYPFSWLSRL